MRLLLAITMVVLFGFPMAAPLFGLDAASNLPECCRRNGRHHCDGGMVSNTGESAISSVSSFSTIAPKCPTWPKSTAAPWPHTLGSLALRSTGTPLYAHPGSTPQTEARYRVAFTRSRQKRGPPAVIL